MGQKSSFVSVMGTMGSGKTTATKLLATHFGWQLLEENFGENAFLSRFYQEPNRWAFHSQTFFLMEKLNQILSVEGMLTEGSVVQDTPIYQDVFGYAQTQHTLGNLDVAEWKLYQKIFRAFEAYLPKPDAIVYLETSIPVVVARIQKRGRRFEQEIPVSYLEALQAQNEMWLKTTSIPVLRINTDHLNLATNRSSQNEFLEAVRKELQ